ncbi:MAG: GntR family transcriptional regulator [Hyphomicrobiaceae bacterium]
MYTSHLKSRNTNHAANCIPVHVDNKPALSAPVLARLKERIIQWDYPPGHRLTEQELCQEFGVSRVPVREALHVLIANGLVEQLPRRGGYRVRQLDLRGITELYDVRMALELFVVERLATQGLAAETLAEQRRAWESVRPNGAMSRDELADLDRNFHEALARAAGNMTMLKQLQAINERLSLFRAMDFAVEERVEYSCRQHLAIIERIAAGDSSGACSAMRANIKHGLDNVETAIKDALAKAYLKSAEQ